MQRLTSANIVVGKCIHVTAANVVNVFNNRNLPVSSPTHWQGSTSCRAERTLSPFIGLVPIGGKEAKREETLSNPTLRINLFEIHGKS